jgi:dTDP-4-dehydrorhamnose reductase
MKVLLTGANGQLGRCVRDVFANSEHDVIALDRQALDISSESTVASTIAFHNPEVILNAAAYTAVDKAESEPEQARAINGLAPGILAAAAKDVGARIIHISTDYVFDGGADKPYAECDLVNPQGVYGKTKLEGELAVQENIGAFVILRTAWVFSEYGNNFLKTMLRLGADRSELGVVADQVGCPTYAGNIASACLAIVDGFAEGNERYGIYHYAGNGAVSWHDFALYIFEEAQRQGVLAAFPKVNAIGTVDYPTPAKRPAYSVLDNRKIACDYGVVASDWRSAVKRVVALLA